MKFTYNFLNNLNFKFLFNLFRKLSKICLSFNNTVASASQVPNPSLYNILYSVVPDIWTKWFTFCIVGEEIILCVVVLLDEKHEKRNYRTITVSLILLQKWEQSRWTCPDNDGCIEIHLEW